MERGALFRLCGCNLSSGWGGWGGRSGRSGWISFFVSTLLIVLLLFILLVVLLLFILLVVLLLFILFLVFFLFTLFLVTILRSFSGRSSRRGSVSGGSSRRGTFSGGSSRRGSVSRGSIRSSRRGSVSGGSSRRGSVSGGGNLCFLLTAQLSKMLDFLVNLSHNVVNMFLTVCLCHRVVYKIMLTQVAGIHHLRHSEGCEAGAHQIDGARDPKHAKVFCFYYYCS